MSIKSFEALGIVSFFRARLSARDIHKPAEIQELVIPRLLSGESLVFKSPTGSGKTFAYLLPVLQRLFVETAEAVQNARAEDNAEDSENPHSAESANIARSVKHTERGGRARFLICAPTHELCSQIKGELDFLLESFPTDTKPKAVLLVGQANLERQIETLKKERPEIVVGNPGRLLQLARMRKLRLDGIAALVLDEGDRLCSDELLETTAELFRFLPKKDTQTISCSATLSAKSRERLLPLLSPETGIVETEGMSKGIEHWAFFSEDRKKIANLRSFLSATKPKKALVFAARGAEAGNILSQLQHHHIAAGGIWGDLDKKARKAALDNFRKGNISVLVATDLACRGLDIPLLTHVIALDVPKDPELYLHRSGRTGRQGKRGVMASIGNEEDLRNLQRIEQKLGMIVYPKELYGGRILPAGGEAAGGGGNA